MNRAASLPRPDTTPLGLMALLALAVVAAGGAAWLVIDGRPVPAGLATLGAAMALVLVGYRARRMGVPRVLFTDSVAERTTDAAVLGGVAWAAMPGAPRVAAAALTALGMAYLASYLKARATGLGWELRESVIDRGVRMGAVSAGLLSGFVEAGLWISAAWSAAVLVYRAREVGRQGEPR